MLPWGRIQQPTSFQCRSLVVTWCSRSQTRFLASSIRRRIGSKRLLVAVTTVFLVVVYFHLSATSYSHHAANERAPPTSSRQTNSTGDEYLPEHSSERDERLVPGHDVVEDVQEEGTDMLGSKPRRHPTFAYSSEKLKKSPLMPADVTNRHRKVLNSDISGARLLNDKEDFDENDDDDMDDRDGVVVNPHNFRVLHSPRPEHVCSERLDLVILVASTPEKIEARRAIRETWGLRQTRAAQRRSANSIHHHADDDNDDDGEGRGEAAPSGDTTDADRSASIKSSARNNYPSPRRSAVIRDSDDRHGGSSHFPVRQKRGKVSVAEQLAGDPNGAGDDSSDYVSFDDGKEGEDEAPKLSTDSLSHLAGAVKVVFMFGVPSTVRGEAEKWKLMSIIEDEAKLYGDVLQEDFVDSYGNLTLKTVMGVKWASRLPCFAEMGKNRKQKSGAGLAAAAASDEDKDEEGRVGRQISRGRDGAVGSSSSSPPTSSTAPATPIIASPRCLPFLMKTDDDVFVNVPNLIRHLPRQRRDESHPACVRRPFPSSVGLRRRPGVGGAGRGGSGDDGAESLWIAGCNKLRGSLKPIPAGNFSLPKAHPDFLAGAGYVMPGALVGALWRKSLRERLVPVEDVFLTGRVAARLTSPPVRLVHDTRFSCGQYVDLNPPSGAQTARRVRRLFTVHLVSPPGQRRLWKLVTASSTA